MSPMSLSGKKIAVTGASSGIGRAVAQECARFGAEVVLFGRNAERLRETQEAMCSPQSHLAVVCDFTREKDLAPILDDVVADGKRLDGLVHCAGIPGVMPLKALSEERLHAVMEVNFYSFVTLVRFFSRPKYSNTRSSIIGISSSVILHPRKCELGYVASKAAMEAACKVMALELASRETRVNCVSPGSVRTEMIRRIQDEQESSDMLESIADRAIFGWQDAVDIADVCAFLLSDLSRSITGQILRADGGYL